MEIGIITGATRVLGAPAEWDHQKGSCAGLPVLDRETENGPVMISEWQPTPEELERLVQGMPVHLWIYGEAHPAVAVSVGESAHE